MNEANNLNIMDALNQKVYPALAQGHYKAMITGYNAVNNERGGYLNLYLGMEDGRTITHTVFPKGILYITENLLRQFNYQQPVSLGDILAQRLNQPIDIWVSYNEFGRNIAFHDNLTKVQEMNTPIDAKALEQMLRM